MSRVILFFAPGLGRRFVQKGTMPWLSSALNPSCFAELVPPFPCLPEVVIHSALCGQSPAVHGRVLTRDAGDPSRAAASVANFAPQLQVEIDAGLLHDARAGGLDSPSRLAKAAELDEKLHELFDAREEDALLLVAGLAGARPAGERIALEHLSCVSAAEVEVESAILRVRCAQTARREEVREALLRLRGVERVLQGEALAAFGVPEEGGALILALAREGFSFQEEQASVGSCECARGEEGILLGLGCPADLAWPTKLHAVRLAPSLAAHLGHPTRDYADRPFPL